jgi:large subunit ribosomal protein L5
MQKSRLETKYIEEIAPNLKAHLELKNVMEVPRLLKIVLNVGVKDAVSDSKAITLAQEIITSISGQQSCRRLARKSNASFKLREGMPIGAMVTLRRRMMYEFLDRLVSLSLPRIRDFHGVSRKFDGSGNYNLGIREWSIFPEVDAAVGQKVFGLNITMHTSARNDDHGLKLLELFGIPFKKTK